MQKELIKKAKVSEDTSTIQLKMHTIVLLIGPSGCGKTYFTQKNIIPKIEEAGLSYAHLSSDNIRRELLGDASISKMDPRMAHSSKAAFSLLNAKLRAFTSYPINTEFVVVDSTGLSKDFRDDIKKIADENNYNLVVVMFDYKGRSPYYDYITDDESKSVTSRQIDYMREKVMSEVSKKTFKDIYKVKSRDFENYTIEFSDLERYNECKLSSELDYVIIGDIHGCYNEFVELLKKNGFEIKDGKITHEDSTKRIALVGDLVDKGYDVRSVIELVYNNLDMFNMVIGNHENFVYKYLRNEVDKDSMPPQEIIDVYFDSIKLFESDEELKGKFFTVVQAMKPFLKHNDFIITHAPCDQKYLGKLGTNSERSQRTVAYPKEVDFSSPQEYAIVVSEFFKFFRNQASRSLPFHVFGHVSTKDVAKLYNKINIDTGAVSGGQLTSILVNRSGRHYISHVSSAGNENVKKKELRYFFEVPPTKISIDALEGREKGRILTAAEKKVNFISGTICPADKKVVLDENKNLVIAESELESLEEAIAYFKKKGITKVVAQPKYMGSRSNIYLFKDPEQNYTTSRGGHIIKPSVIDLTEAYKPLYELPYIKQAFGKDTKMLILDAELLPWSAIGKGLIESEFVTVDKAIKSEIEFLKNTGFEEALLSIYEGQYKDIDFERISNKTSREELIKMIGSNNEKTFRCIKDYMREFVSLDEMSELLSVYSKQIELYGSDDEVHFKVFSILKEVFEDDSEKLFFDESNEEIYAGVNTDEFLVVDIDNKEEVKALFDFYNKTTVIEEMEGIMLKPIQVFIKGVAPSIKVRNPRYLTIVYGPDYQNEFKLGKLIGRKKIKRKLELSVKEWEIGKRILEIPYNQISKENEHFIQAYGEMVIEERGEKELDPRL